MRKVHTLKCAPVHYEAVKAYRKTAEVRFDDRGFQVGDVIELFPYRADLGVMDDGIVRVVTHILTSDEGPWLSPGYVMLSFGDAAMTSPDPTPAEIEAAAREWCRAMGLNPDDVCSVQRDDTYSDCPPEYDEAIRWELWAKGARALIAMRAKDKARIAELEAQLASIREAAQHACDVREQSEILLARITLRAALAAAPETRG